MLYFLCSEDSKGERIGTVLLKMIILQCIMEIGIWLKFEIKSFLNFNILNLMNDSYIFTDNLQGSEVGRISSRILTMLLLRVFFGEAVELEITTAAIYITV